MSALPKAPAPMEYYRIGKLLASATASVRDAADGATKGIDIPVTRERAAEELRIAADLLCPPPARRAAR